MQDVPSLAAMHRLLPCAFLSPPSMTLCQSPGKAWCPPPPLHSCSHKQRLTCWFLPLQALWGNEQPPLTQVPACDLQARDDMGRRWGAATVEMGSLTIRVIFATWENMASVFSSEPTIHTVCLDYRAKQSDHWEGPCWDQDREAQSQQELELQLPQGPPPTFYIKV